MKEIVPFANDKAMTEGKKMPEALGLGPKLSGGDKALVWIGQSQNSVAKLYQHVTICDVVAANWE
jgi:hypothetical protein